MAKIVYLHGFASSGNSAKSRALKDAFGEENVFAPNLPIGPNEVCEIVSQYLASINDEQVIFVGTSLGGFYADYFSAIYKHHAVLVNPSFRPDETMLARLGKHTNYATGQEFEITEEHISVWRMMVERSRRRDQSLISMFLAKDDDVLVYERALEIVGDPEFLSITPDGGHRYDMHWNKVVEHIKTLR